MTTFDRYVFGLFTKVLLVCFGSMAGLYIIIDTFNNLDEFLGLGKQLGGVGAVLADYYGARLPWFFDRASAFMTLVAAMCAVGWLHRTNELTAVMAAGVSKRRVIRSLVIAAVLVAGAAAANREVVLPNVRDRLIRNAQDWLGKSARYAEPVTDNQTEVLMGGKAIYISERRIEQPFFQLYRPYRGFGKQLHAQNAYHSEAQGDRPAGYLLDGVSEPNDVSKLASVVQDGRTILLTPREHSWLKPNQLFVASQVGFEQLAGGSAWRKYASTPELIANLRNPSLDFGLDSKVMVHSRVVQPFLDLSLFFLGLPLVLTRENRNIFVAAGWCLLLILLFFIVVMACQAMGNGGYLVSPSLAAWLPLMIFAPLAAAMSYPIWER